MASLSMAVVGMDTHSLSNKVSRSFEVVAVSFISFVFRFYESKCSILQAKHTGSGYRMLGLLRLSTSEFKDT